MPCLPATRPIPLLGPASAEGHKPFPAGHRHTPWPAPAQHRHLAPCGGCCRPCRAFQEEVQPDEAYDWVARNQALLQKVPLAAGTLGIAGVLLNRALFGIAPVADAGSAQSRVDVLVIGLSGVLVLTGLQWLALKPRPLVKVPQTGPEVSFTSDALSPAARAELECRALRAWQALSRATPTCGLVAFHGGRCVAQFGRAAPQGVPPGDARPGPLCEKARASGKPNYLANLAPYPGRFEFFEYLPESTQGVLVHPLGDSGTLVLATDAQRAYGRVDQAWVATVAQKLESTLAAWAEEGTPSGYPA